MVIWIATGLRRLANRVRTRKALLAFLRGALVGSHFACGPYSACINGSGLAENIQIGNRVEILGCVVTAGDGRIRIGNHVTIRGGSQIGAVSFISIGDYVIISSDVIVYDNNNHPTEVAKRREMLESGFCGPLWQWENSRAAPVSIADHVWIGQRAVVLKGVSIGQGSIVGMGAVVTEDVPPYSIAVGNPARCLPLGGALEDGESLAHEPEARS